MSFNSIPDDCIRLVLDRLSSQLLIPLRIICRRWKAIVESMCRGKRSLILRDKAEFAEDQSLSTVPDSDAAPRLVLCATEILNKRKCPFECYFLAELFCNLTYLDVHFCVDNSMKDIIPLLLSNVNVCSTLTRLSIRTNMVLYPFIWQQINQLTKLEILNVIFKVDDTIPEGMTILCQLKHFSVWGHVTNLLSVLYQLGSEIRSITLSPEQTLSDLINFDQFEIFARTSQMAHYVTRIDFSLYGVPVEDLLKFLSIICTHFRALTALNILAFVYKISIDKIFTELSRLPNLAELDGLVLTDEFIDQHPCLLCPLKSVQLLSIFTSETFENTTSFIRYLPKVFPALKELHVWENFESTLSRSECLQIEKQVEAIGTELEFESDCCNYNCGGHKE